MHDEDEYTYPLWIAILETALYFIVSLPLKYLIKKEWVLFLYCDGIGIVQIVENEVAHSLQIPYHEVLFLVFLCVAYGAGLMHFSVFLVLSVLTYFKADFGRY